VNINVGHRTLTIRAVSRGENSSRKLRIENLCESSHSENLCKYRKINAQAENHILRMRADSRIVTVSP